MTLVLAVFHLPQWNIDNEDLDQGSGSMRDAHHRTGKININEWSTEVSDKYYLGTSSTTFFAGAGCVLSSSTLTLRRSVVLRCWVV